MRDGKWLRILTHIIACEEFDFDAFIDLNLEHIFALLRLISDILLVVES